MREKEKMLREREKAKIQVSSTFAFYQKILFRFQRLKELNITESTEAPARSNSDESSINSTTTKGTTISQRPSTTSANLNHTSTEPTESFATESVKEESSTPGMIKTVFYWQN